MSKIIVAMLAVLTFAINIPGESLAQGPQPVGGVATVIGVDQPENCLRIRSGPGNNYDVIGCANMGEQLNITGVWTSNDWAQLADNAWVYGPQIQTDLRPPPAAYYKIPSYVVTEEVIPDYYDWGYLPYCGYDTYWCGGIPIFFYNIGAWYRFHPWWWHRGHQAWWWRDGHHGRRPWDPATFNNYVRARANRNFVTNHSNVSSFNRTATPRNFTTNRSNVSSFNRAPRNFVTNRANVNRFNTNRFRSGYSNAFRARTFSNPNAFRSGSTHALRSRSFSTPIRTFSTPRSFSGPRTFSMGGRSFGGFAGRGGRHR
jgi:hypothetical protein